MDTENAQSFGKTSGDNAQVPHTRLDVSDLQCRLPVELEVSLSINEVAEAIARPV